MKATLLAIALVFASFVGTSSAVTPQQTIKQLRSELSTARKANARLTAQNALVERHYVSAKASLATANATLTTAGPALTAAQAQVATDQITIANLNSELLGAAQTIISGMNGDQLWQVLSSVSLRMGQVGGTKYSTSVFSGSSFSSYDFDLFN